MQYNIFDISGGILYSTFLKIRCIHRSQSIVHIICIINKNMNIRTVTTTWVMWLEMAVAFAN